VKLRAVIKKIPGMFKENAINTIDSSELIFYHLNLRIKTFFGRNCSGMEMVLNLSDLENVHRYLEIPYGDKTILCEK
jgi:hypothetical protein